eukprot:Nk52_evm3s478 gene=Nk52_evmTU3s478
MPSDSSRNPNAHFSFTFEFDVEGSEGGQHSEEQESGAVRGAGSDGGGLIRHFNLWYWWRRLNHLFLIMVLPCIVVQVCVLVMEWSSACELNLHLWVVFQTVIDILMTLVTFLILERLPTEFSSFTTIKRRLRRLTAALVVSTFLDLIFLALYLYGLWLVMLVSNSSTSECQEKTPLLLYLTTCLTLLHSTFLALFALGVLSLPLILTVWFLATRRSSSSHERSRREGGAGGHENVRSGSIVSTSTTLSEARSQHRHQLEGNNMGFLGGIFGRSNGEQGYSSQPRRSRLYYDEGDREVDLVSDDQEDEDTTVNELGQVVVVVNESSTPRVEPVRISRRATAGMINGLETRVYRNNNTQSGRNNKVVYGKSGKGSSKHNEEDEEEKDFCGICLSTYLQNDRQRFLPCKHYFHSDCVDQWLLTDKSCPICKRDIDLLMEE